jgi:hypothetical protein
MTEKCSTFDKSVKYILETSLEIHDKAYKGSQGKRLWMMCIEKFFKVYTKINKPEKFYDMFINFYRDHMEGFSLPIFQSSPDGNTVNDSWLKDDTFKDVLDIKQPNKSSNAWEPTVTRCKGWVIYASQDKSQNLISIPVSEIYLTAIKLCREEKIKDPVCATYPAKILFSLFSIIYHALPDSLYADVKVKINDNIELLSQHIVTILPDDAEMSDDIGTGFNAITKMVTQVAKSSGLNDGSVDTTMIEKSLTEVAQKDNINNISDLFQTAYKKYTSAETSAEGFAGIIDKIGKTLQNDEIKSKISTVKLPKFPTPITNTELADSSSSSSSSSASSASSASSTSSTADPSEQD